MKGLLVYLLQVIICSGVLYGYYYIALRNKKFHLYNRYYLLATMLISIIVPFLHIPVYFASGAQSAPAFIQILGGVYISEGAETETIKAVAGFNWLNVLRIVYLSIAAIIFIRLIISLIRISGILRKYEIEKIDQYYFVNTTEAGTPFSFIKWIFWNKEIDLHSSNGQQIFRHELYHLRHKHSIDIIFTEILTAVYWVNPFFHLIRKEVKTIHEFLADQFAATENDKWNYAELLLMQVLRSPNRLINPFFHNQIKRRIAMITSSQQANFRYLRKLMVLPVAAIIIAVFAFQYKAKPAFAPTRIDKTITVVIDAGHGQKANGKFSGAIGVDGTYEDEIVLNIAKKIKKLNANDRINIILTREDAKSVEVPDRIGLANNQKADLFISIHTNASVNASQRNGVEVFVPAVNTGFYAENRILANIILNYMSKYYTVSKEYRERTENSVAVLDKSNCPAVLVECGYITNKEDLEFTKSELGQEEIAKSILKSIEQYALQSEMPEWNEKKSIFLDTTKKRLTIIKDPSGNPKAMYNGKAVTKINETEGMQLALWIGESEVILLGKKESEDIKKKYGSNLQGLLIPQVTKWKLADKQDQNIDNKIFQKVEIEAEFPGGVNAWRKFLNENIKAAVPLDKGAPAGKYTVWVQFIVDSKDGSIANLKALTKMGYGMEEEALRVMKLSPNWTPAIQNGKKVKAYRKQPINFEIYEQ